MRSKFLLTIVLLLFVQISFSQTVEDREKAKELGISEFQMLEFNKYLNEKRTNVANGYPTSGEYDKVGKLDLLKDSDYYSKKAKEASKSVFGDSIHNGGSVVGKGIELESNEKEIPVFGRNIFQGEDLDVFRKTEGIKATGQYILGPGDEILITIWGYSEFNGAFTVDLNGAINPSRVGRIYVKGLALADVRKIIKAKFSKFFDLKNSEIEIEVNYSRDINVNIVGEVNNPGSYSLKGVHSAFNALYAANGVNEFGSLRSIQVIRNGELVGLLDVYNFLTNPMQEHPIYLQDGDFIVVPSIGKLVEVKGEIKRPMNYELLPGEGLKDLFRFSGGPTAEAYLKNIEVVRIVEFSRKFMNISYTPEEDKEIPFSFEDGDIVNVRPTSESIHNIVEIKGAVHIPGKYELEDSMTISDLVNASEGLLFDAYKTRAYLVRTNQDQIKEYSSFNIQEALLDTTGDLNFELKNFDQIIVFSKSDFIDSDSVSISGMVRKPGNYAFGEKMNLKDLLYLSGGLKKQAAVSRIEISRVLDYDQKLTNYRPSRTVVKVIEVDFSFDSDSKDVLFELKPMDQVFVRKEADYEEQRNVTILGEVKFPGTYTLLTKNDRLSDLIDRAGGLTDVAFLEGSKFYRSEGEKGALFLDMRKIKENKKSNFNYALRANDTIVIAQYSDLVSVGGAVEYPNIDSIGKINGPFVKGKRAKFYVKRYGVGFDRENGAVRRWTYVMDANGIVSKTKNFGLFKRFPKVETGGYIFVNSREETEKKKDLDTNPIDWNKMFESFTVKVSGILSLYFLIDRVALN